MTPNGFYGFNVQAQGVRDKERLLQYVRAVKPKWMIVLDGVGLAKEIKAASPTTNVVVRQYQKDGYWIGKDPAYFLSEMRKYIGDADVWVYADNEVGLNPDWNIRLMEMNTTNPLKLAMIHLPVGNPRDLNEWNNPRVLAMLKMMSDHRDWAVAFFHEYFCVVPTSGMIGGYPDNAGVDPKNPKPGQVGRNLIPVAGWPHHAEIYNPADPITLFHQGRFNFAVQAFKKAYPNAAPVRVALSECGADDVSDIKDWSIRLKVAPGYLNVRGWRTLFPQWREWYKGWGEDQTYAEMLKYAAEQIYADSWVEGACIYCYAFANSEWEQFSVEGRSDLLGYLEQYAAQKEADLLTKTQSQKLPKPKPINASNPRKVKAIFSGANRTVRGGDGADYKAYKTIPSGTEITMYDPISKDAGGAQWAWIESAEVNGYLPIDGVDFNPVPPPAPSKEDETLPSKPAAPAPGIDDPEVTPITPVMKTFEIPLKVQVKATSEEAAMEVAILAMSYAKNGWTTMVAAERLRQFIANKGIEDAQFILDLPKGG